MTNKHGVAIVPRHSFKEPFAVSNVPQKISKVPSKFLSLPRWCRDFEVTRKGIDRGDGGALRVLKWF